MPVSEDDKGYSHISSPMPKPELTTRIIANDFPSKTYSPTSFDLPLRKDVVQTQIPTSVTRTFENSSDPRHPKKVPVARVTGTLYHGTGSVDPRVVHGSFLEKKIRMKRKKISEKKCKNVDSDIKDTLQSKKEGLHYARQTFDTASAMLGSITNGQVDSPHMILNVDVQNKREQPDLQIYAENENRKHRLAALRHTPAGVRAAHTLRRLG